MSNDTHRNLVLMGGAHVHLGDHLEKLREGGWRITHLHERDPARRARLCDALGAEPLPYLDAVRDPGLSGAVICSETCHHLPDAMAALDAGLPVFCEKPLAGSANAAQRIADAAEASGLLFHVGYFMRTNPALALAHDWIGTGHIGRINSARMRFSHDGGYADWLDLDSWMTAPDLACYGGFADEAVHAIDMLQWLVGPIFGAKGITGNALGWPVDDHGAAVLRFENGATGVIEAGWTDTRMRLELDILGEAGAISLQDGQISLTRRGNDSPSGACILAPLDAGAGIVPFLRALDGETASGLVPPHDAARVNALLDSMGLRLWHGPPRPSP